MSNIKLKFGRHHSGSGIRPLPHTPSRAYDFHHMIGVNVHVSYTDTSYGNTPQDMSDILGDIGIMHVREGVSHPVSTYVTGWVNTFYSEHGIKALLVFDPREGGLTAAQLSGTVMDNIKTAMPNAWDFIEGPNEMDINWGPGWDTVFHDYHVALKAARDASSTATNIPIVLGSIVQGFNLYSLPEGDYTSYVDYGMGHWYFNAQPPSWEDGAYGAVSRIDWSHWLAPGKDVVLTEFGYHSAINNPGAFPVTEAANAKYHLRAWPLWWNLGAIERAYKYELFDLQDDVYNETWPPEWGTTSYTSVESNWGLCHYDHSYKLVATALKRFIALIRDDSGASLTPTNLTYALGTQNPNVNSLLLQKSSGVYVLIVWQEVESYNRNTLTDLTVPRETASLRFNATYAQVKTYEPYNSSTATNTYTSVSQVPLSIPDHPLIVEITP